LIEALDILKELGEANELEDRSHWYLSSIAPHTQNEHAAEWTLLIELCRDAWLSTTDVTPALARLEALRWGELRYPLFRRLQLFAASQAALFTTDEAISILVRDDCWWLWSAETKREALRLIASLAAGLSFPDQRRLCDAILHEPPVGLFRPDIEAESRRRAVDQERWLRLAKYRASGGILTSDAEAEFVRLTNIFPERTVEDDERDEFSSWVSSAEWVGGNYIPATEPLRSDPLKLAEYLATKSTSVAWREDDWAQTCRDAPDRAIEALLILAKDDIWRVDVWRVALQVFAEETYVHRSWDALSPVLVNADQETLADLGNSVSRWLATCAKSISVGIESIIPLTNKLLDVFKGEKISSDDDRVFRAINHPVGHCVQGVLNWWYRQELRDHQELPASMSEILVKIMNPAVHVFRYGRMVLAANVLALFRVDPAWTIIHVIPTFDWTKDAEEARSAWEGFLLAPRLYRPLLAALRTSFLATAAHYRKIRKYAHQYAALLTLVGLELFEPFKAEEIQYTTSLLPVEGLHTVTTTLVRALQDADDRKVEYWANRVKPYLRSIWPKDIVLYDDRVRVNLGRVCIAADGAFPEALEIIGPWLARVSNTHLLTIELEKSGLCNRFPDQSLRLLDLMLGETETFPDEHALRCLQEIGQAKPMLKDLDSFNRIRHYFMRLGKSF